MAYNFNNPDRGEIVNVVSTEDGSSQLKRVIGLPGDIVEIKGRTVCVNGVPLEEPYVQRSPEFTLPSYEVQPDNFFVLSDMRSEFQEDYSSWTVTRQDIEGRAWVYSWPPDRWGTVASYPLDSQLAVVETY
jgi:signal peptidase I